MLTDELLDRIRGRAQHYDRENLFFWEDLNELRAAGHLRPRPLLELARDQRRLAAFAPATALGVNMHLVWVGVAAALKARGDDSLAFVLDEADAGELFAFGISEPGNDSVLWDSLTVAQPVDGGFAFTGTKVFTSLSPAWTRLSVFGRHGDTLVHGFIHRDDSGWHSVEDWNTLGMRATQSHTTILDGVVVPHERIVRTLPVGPNADPFVFGIFANFLLLISAVYAGIGDRALELGVAAAHRRVSHRDGTSYAQNPDIRRSLAEAALSLDALAPQIETLAVDVDRLVDHGPRWFRLLTGVKHRATESARDIVEQAMRVAGGGAYGADAELSRLQRDVLAGIYHPSSTSAVHATVASDLLGPLP